MHAITRTLRVHWLFAIVVAIGVIVRVLTMVGYPPALLFPDSWGYIASAFSGIPNELPSVHPVGYPVLVWLLTQPDRSLAELTAFQHLGGIGIGIAVYVTLLRAGLPLWAATGAAALTLLDGYGITLEQYVMSDTFFAVFVLAATLVIAWPQVGTHVRGDADAALRRADGRQTGRAMIAGLLVAAATLVRELAPFVIPVFVIYQLWIRTGWRPILAFLVAALLPLLGYAVAMDGQYKVFGITATSGWTLYGRVAGFASCDGLKLTAVQRKLCETPAQRASHPDAPDWYVWGPSPAQRVFHPDTQSVAQVATTNQALQSFAKEVIRHHPLDFVGVTLRDFGDYFTPDVTAYQDAVSATSLPVSAREEATSPATQSRDLPGLKVRVRGVSKLVRAYRSVLHVPRPVLALLALAALLGLCLRVPSRREVWLFAGSGVILLLGTAATGGFGLRYLIPAVPLLAIGGVLAAADLRVRWTAANHPD